MEEKAEKAQQQGPWSRDPGQEGKAWRRQGLRRGELKHGAKLWVSIHGRRLVAMMVTCESLFQLLLLSL